MRRIRNFFLFALISFCVFHPQYMNTEGIEDNTIVVAENIRNMNEFLRTQDYFEQVSQLCHESNCFSIDIHDLERSLSVMEEKVIDAIRLEFGEDVATEAKLKGFSITKILTR